MPVELTRDVLEIVGMLLGACILTAILMRLIYKSRLKKLQAKHDDLATQLTQAQSEKNEMDMQLSIANKKEQNAFARLGEIEKENEGYALEISNLQPYKVRYETAIINLNRAKTQVETLEAFSNQLQSEKDGLNLELQAKEAMEQMMAEEDANEIAVAEIAQADTAAVADTRSQKMFDEEKMEQMKEASVEKFNAVKSKITSFFSSKKDNDKNEGKEV